MSVVERYLKWSADGGLKARARQVILRSKGKSNGVDCGDTGVCGVGVIVRLQGTFWKFNDLSVSDVGLRDFLQCESLGRTASQVGRLRRRKRGRYVGSVWGGQRGWVGRDRLRASPLSRSRLGNVCVRNHYWQGGRMGAS